MYLKTGHKTSNARVFLKTNGAKPLEIPLGKGGQPKKRN